MTGTPKSLRLRVGLFGRTNTGKSSLLNLITGQEAAIVSPVAGTTTDVVEKSMELLPIGPVTFLDTAGIDDSSELGALRTAKTDKALASADVCILVTEAGSWTPYEEGVAGECARQKKPVIIAINKTDIATANGDWIAGLKEVSKHVIEVSSTKALTDRAAREAFMRDLKRMLIESCPDDFLDPPAILGDLLPSGGGLPLVVLVVPIDLQAPKGRLILPQVQSIRDCLDSDAAVTVVKDREYAAFLRRLSAPPDLVVCDSQAVLKTIADTPAGIPCTTFSILFSRYKGNIVSMARGAAVLSRLEPGDRVLIAEACTHHALEDDIGRVKIPRWLRQFTGADIEIVHSAGKDYPENLADFKLVIHCGACTLTRREMLWRIERAEASGVAVTNYGMAISALQGVIERALGPFPAALEAWREASGEKG